MSEFVLIYLTLHVLIHVADQLTTTHRLD